MPIIKSSAELRNSYSEVSDQCHRYGEPVYITRNGKGDLALMSIEAYEEMAGRLELYSLIREGLDDANAEQYSPFEDVMNKIRSEDQNK